MIETTDAVSQYFKGIQRLSQPLSREENHDLWKKAKKGDKPSQKRLMESNLRLVVPIAKKYQRLGIDFLDLIE